MLELLLKVIFIKYLICILVLDALKCLIIHVPIFNVIVKMSILRAPSFSLAPGPQNLRTGPAGGR